MSRLTKSIRYRGQSPYSATKIGADKLAEAFYRSFQLPVTIVRPFNTFGPRQSTRAVIPTIITKIPAGAREIKLDSLTSTRDFVYVKDTAQAFLNIAASENTLGETLNIATGRDISIGKLAQTIKTHLRSEARIFEDDKRIRPKKLEVERLQGNSAKLRTLTNWQPRYTFEQGLAETIAWFQEASNRERYKPDMYNV